MRSRDLTAERAAELLRGIRPRDAAGKTLRGLAADLVAEIRQLDRRIAKAAADIQTAVTDSGTTLTELCGIGALTAGKILGRVGTIDRFRSAAAFAYLHRHRPDRGVFRRCCPPSAFARRRPPTQPLPARHGPYPDPAGHPGQGLLPAEANRRQGPQGSDAMPQTTAIRRRLPTTPPRRRPDWGRAREDTRGRLYRPARPAQTPHTDASDKSLPGPATSHPTTHEQRPLDTERRRLVSCSPVSVLTPEEDC